MNQNLKYTTQQPSYKPMGNQSNGTRTRKYNAYNENSQSYTVSNFTITPEVPKYYGHKSLDSKRILDANTYKVVETQPSILKRLVTAVFTVKNSVQQAIRDLFSRKSKQ